MKDLLDLESRREIYDLILKNPGLHLSRIAEILKMSLSLVKYHLYHLEKNKLIRSEKEKGYSRYYVEGEIDPLEKKALSLLWQEVPFKVVLFLIKNDRSQHKEILKNFNIASSTLSYHLKKMVKLGIISVSTHGNDRGYTIVDKEKIIQIIIKYKPYKIIESFKDIWEHLGI